MKFLLDEHLSPALVSRISSLGLYAAAVAHIGLCGASDPVIWRYAYENGFVVVTTNAKDFLPLLNIDVHPGLIVLRESGLSRAEQWNRLEPVLQHLLTLSDPDCVLNRVIEIESPNHFSKREVPPPELDS